MAPTWGRVAAALEDGAAMAIQAAARGRMLRKAIAELNLHGMLRLIRWASISKAGLFGRRALDHAHKAGIVLEKRVSTAGVAYVMQGNSEFYSAANVRRRWALRHHADIRRAIGRLWDRLVANGAADASSSSAALSRAEYRRFYKAAYKQMLGLDEYARPAFVATFDAEWAADVGADATHIARPAFADAIFELADLWCDSLDAADYVALLDGLSRNRARQPDSEDDNAASVHARDRRERPATSARAPWKVGGEWGWGQVG